MNKKKLRKARKSQENIKKIRKTRKIRKARKSKAIRIAKNKDKLFWLILIYFVKILHTSAKPFWHT